MVVRQELAQRAGNEELRLSAILVTKHADLPRTVDEVNQASWRSQSRSGLYQQPHAAALPGRAQNLRYRGLDALVCIGDDELDASQATAGELAQEGGPEGLGFGRTDVHAQHLATTVS